MMRSLQNKTEDRGATTSGRTAGSVGSSRIKATLGSASLLAGLFIASIGLASTASASLGNTVEPAPLIEASTQVDVKLHNSEGQGVLNSILNDPAFWGDAWKKSYSGKIYDEVRLKSTTGGYVPMITGEGGQDFDNSLISDVVFKKNTLLPRHMSGAKHIVFMGSGTDSTVGAEYRDTFYVLDLTVFYGVFPQRMYRKTDASGKTVLWFEKLKPEFVTPEKWTAYQATMKKTTDNMEKRWPPFNAVIEVSEVYGMFVVEPGKTQKTRVSFVSKLTFDEDAGWVAQMGSQLPSVIRAGLRAGFGACVQIAEDEKKRAAATPK